MNTSYNYADFIGMNFDSNIDHEFQDDASSHKQLNISDNQMQTSDVNDCNTDDKNTDQLDN